MKNKYFAMFLACLYFFFCNAQFVLADNLYFVKNSSVETIKPSIVNILEDKKFNINRTDPYYAVSAKDSSVYALIILQKSSENYFYYIDSNDKRLNKSILKSIKNSGVVYEESFNAQYLSMFQNQAQRVLTNTVGQYSFSSQNPVAQEVQQTVLPSKEAEQPKTDNSAVRGMVTQILAGSVFKAYLETSINTSTACVGDEVRAILSEDQVVNGKIVSPRGSLLTGRITTAKHASYGSRNGRVVFTFNTLTTPDGKTYNLSSEEVDFTVTNDGKWSKSAGAMTTAALTGALVGLLISSCSGGNILATTAISAGAGAATGALTVASQKGVDAEIPVYTELEIKLLKPFSVVADY